MRGPGGLGIDGARAVGAGRRQPAQRFLDEGGGPEHRRAIGVRGCDAVGGKVRRALRDVKGEGGAPAERGRDGDGPLVQLHQLLHEGEPDAGTFDGPRAPALDAEEPIVKVRDVLGGDSDAGVLDAQDDGAVGGVQRHGDRPLEGELDRVRDQVEDDLLPHAAIDEDRLAERRTVDQEGEPGALDRREERRGEVVRQGGEIHRFEVGLRAARFEARDVEQGVDQLVQAVGVALHQLELRALRGRQGAVDAVEQIGGRREHQHQRRAEFVAHVAEEAGLGAVQRRQRLDARPLFLECPRRADRGFDLIDGRRNIRR